MSKEERANDPSQVDVGRIEAIRAQTNDTRELVRKVAAYLFLECGIYPSGNRVHQLIQQGSMLTITDELTRWWKVLRERFVSKIPAPDLPESIAAKLGELGGEIWNLAATEAGTIYEAERTRLERIAESASRQAEDAKNEAQSLQEALRDAHQQNSDLRIELGQSEEALAESRQAATMLSNEVERRTEENRETQRQLAKAQEDFSRELQSQRDQTAKIEHRAQDSERKMLLEVDNARQETLRKQAELNKLKEAAERAAENAQHQLAAAHQEISNLTKQVMQTNTDMAVLQANLNSKIQSFESQLASSAELLDAARQALTSSEGRERTLNEQLTSLRAIETMLKERKEEEAQAKAKSTHKKASKS